MAGFKVGFIMFRIIHCSSSFPGSMKKSDWVARPKKANVENDGMERGEVQGEIAGWRNSRGERK